MTHRHPTRSVLWLWFRQQGYTVVNSITAQSGYQGRTVEVS